MVLFTVIICHYQQFKIIEHTHVDKTFIDPLFILSLIDITLYLTIDLYEQTVNRFYSPNNFLFDV